MIVVARVWSMREGAFENWEQLEESHSYRLVDGEQDNQSGRTCEDPGDRVELQ